MTTAPPALDALRREIDAIDDAVHDLIMRRVEIVGAIGRVKTSADTPMLRPAREAQVLRRLVGRHRGKMPVGVVVRLWRELITGGSLGLQQAFSAAVDAGAGDGACWGLARDHYGGSVTMRAVAGAADVIQSVRRKEATVGILPAPRAGEPEPWWPHLAEDRSNPLSVIVKLPFAGGTSAVSAYVVAAMAHEPSGDDRTLIAVSVAGAGDRDTAGVLGRAGIESALLAGPVDGPRGTAWRLFEHAGFVAGDDPRLARLAGVPGIGRALVIGGYATPLSGS